jgi:C-terminal processing protease CtpA/Prc
VPASHPLAVLVLATVAAAACASERGGGSAVLPDTTVDAATRRAVIEGVAARVEASYVFRDRAVVIARAIRARARRGDYDALSSARGLADTLTAHLQAAGRDRHLRVRYSHAVLPPQPWRRSATTGVADSLLARGRRANFGFGRPRRLAGGIGYLEILDFGFEPQWAEGTVAEVMSDLGDAPAIIVDVRRNGGGSPRMVAFVTSYLFGPDSILLNTLYWRGNRIERLYTRSTLPGTRYGPDRPVYVLTGRGTFSAAEGFAYSLQALGRAVIVGDTTGGGAHAGGLHRVTDHFGVWVPGARAVNPVTGRNWERVGVRPDVAVPDSTALGVAHALALRTLLEREPAGERHDRLERALREVTEP